MRILNCLALMICLAAGAADVPSDDAAAGIGVILGTDGQYIVVKKIFPNSPAAVQKGIEAGDKILAVAQGNEPPVSVRSGKLAQTVSLIRGRKGTTVRLTMIPSGGNESAARVVSFVRGEVKALSEWGNGVLLTNGMTAPDIEMVSLVNGKTERLSDSAGKIVVLEFWAAWCGPCQKKMAELQSYAGKHPDWKGKVVLIAASVDDNADIVTRHLKAKGWNQTHNVWVSKPAIKACHIDAFPTAYVIDRHGKIVEANPRDIPGLVSHELQLN